MDEESFKKTCVKEKKKTGGTHQTLNGTCFADFTAETGCRKVYDAGEVFD
jgi:hypothetical protein